MPTNEQRMSPLVRRLHRRIVAERSYSCFQERVSVEEVIKAYACAAGLDVCALLHQWAGMEPRPEPARKRTPRSGNDWPDVLPVDDPDNDVGPEQETRLCPSCKGSGRAKDGSQCARCGGSGRISLDDVDDIDDDEEATSFYGQFEDEE
jgi:hypothetical protein